MNNPLDYLLLLWPDFLSDWIAAEIDNCSGCKAKWVEKSSYYFWAGNYDELKETP